VQVWEGLGGLHCPTLRLC